jgi:hypothetical protein
MIVAIRSAVVSVVCVVAIFAQQMLDNDAVLKLVKAGLSETVIVGMVKNQPGNYSTSADDVISLKTAGVSDSIITAMVEKQSAGEAVPVVTPPPPTPAPDPLILHDGTPVRLRLSRNLSSADAKTGDTVDFEVLEDVVVDGTLVVPREAVAIGTVTLAQAKRRMARGGKLDVEIDYVRLVDGDRVTLRAVKETSGGGHTGAMTGAMVATAIVVWPAAPFFLFMHGKDSTMPKGTEITAYVNGEIKLDRAKFKTAPVALK